MDDKDKAILEAARKICLIWMSNWNISGEKRPSCLIRPMIDLCDTFREKYGDASIMPGAIENSTNNDL